MDVKVALNTLVFKGYSWEVILEEVSKVGVQFLEPVYIAKYDQGLQEDYFNTNNARDLMHQIEHFGLKIRSVSSHMDMGLKSTVGIFTRRLEFAKMLGADIIITNTSHTENDQQFYKNMQALSRRAEELKLTIGLENPGDGQGYIMSNATDGMQIVEQIGSERVRLNYDFSNIFTLTKGKIILDKGLNDAPPYIAHLHLKNIRKENDNWPVCSLEKGIINYAEIFRKYPSLLNIPMSIELPLCYGYNKEFDFIPFKDRRKPSLKRINKILNSSLMFINSLAKQKF